VSEAGAQAVFAYYIGATVLLLVPGIAVMLWMRSLIHRWVAPMPASIDRLWVAKVVFGLVLGQMLYLIAVLPPWIGGAYSPGSPGWEPFGDAWKVTAPMSSVSLTPLIMFQSAYEELLFRAICMGLFAVLLLWLARLLFSDAAREGHSLGPRGWLAIGIAASVVVAAAFAYIHAGNPAVSPLGLVNIALAGILLGLIAWLDGDIWGAWALHFSWNAMIAMSGLPLSGIRMWDSGIANGAVPGLLSGGQFGPEASLPATIAMLAGIAACVWLLRRGFGQGAAGDPAIPPPESDPSE
jgi:membrane protease YdiL (CAAX protease family)